MLCVHWTDKVGKEHVTEYIPDREAANHCTFFTFRNGQPADDDAQLKAKARLASLFGNKPK
ncbi:MAG: hypothetical protein WCJ30_16020 [Deltaproteobacteria bacterium]